MRDASANPPTRNGRNRPINMAQETCDAWFAACRLNRAARGGFHNQAPRAQLVAALVAGGARDPAAARWVDPLWSLLLDRGPIPGSHERRLRAGPLRHHQP